MNVKFRQKKSRLFTVIFYILFIWHTILLCLLGRFFLFVFFSF